MQVLIIAQIDLALGRFSMISQFQMDSLGPLG